VGAVNAITDLNLAIRYWDARFNMLEAVRADSIQTRDEHYQDLAASKGLAAGGSPTHRIVTAHPGNCWHQPGEVHRVQVTPEGQTPAIAYSVLLPPEYSPFHTYHC